MADPFDEIDREVRKRQDLNICQVIQYIGDDTVRIYKMTDAHIGDEDDPLTTIEIDGTYYDKKI
jgi:hypothetical protein